MIDIDNELEDIIPTYDADADVDVVELLKNSTSLGTDEDGNDIPGYIFAGDIADMLELSERDLAKLAQESGYEILSAKIVGEELPVEMLVICRKDFDQEVLKTDYKEIFELDLELTPVENLDDSENTDKESDDEESKKSLKIESVADDKKELGYLWRKEKVSSLDKYEIHRLQSLIQKYGRPDKQFKRESLKIDNIKSGTKIKLNKDTLYADSELEGMFEDDADLLDEFLTAGFILKGTELFIPAGSILTFVMSQSVDVYDLNGLQFEVSEWPDDIDFTVINENVVEANELETRAKRHKKTDRKGARGYFVNTNAGNVEQNIARANHAMGDGSVASSETVGSAPAGLGEDVELDEMLPHKDESKTDFVSRFMGDDKMIKEYENPKQRYAVAISYWEKK